MRRFVIAIIASVSLVSCESGPVEFDDPDGPDPGGNDVPTRVVAVQVAVDPVGQELASALGWAAGVPGAEVGLRQLGTDEWIMTESDQDGLATFEDIQNGRYRVAASRVLTSAEAQQAGTVIRALGDGRLVEIQGNTELTLELLPDDGGGLVISEIANNPPLPWETEGERIGGLAVEIYNGSSERIYLDGMLLGKSYTWHSDTPTHPCTQTASFRQSTDGLYAIWIQRFPGAGSDHALEPGEVAVIAEGAIDHRPVHPDLPDLRGARFEITLSGSANNPAVPDMQDVGLMGWPGSALFRGNLFLSHPVDVASQPTLRDPHTGQDFALIPGASMIDVVGYRVTYPDLGDPNLCMDGPVHRSFDRLHFPQPTTQTSQPRLTLQRRFLRMDEAGRPVLQNTNTSAVDFVLGSRNLGSVPGS